MLFRRGSPEGGPRPEPEQNKENSQQLESGGSDEQINKLAQKLRQEREAGGESANRELDERIKKAGAQPFTQEADTIAREYDLERARQEQEAKEAVEKLAPEEKKKLGLGLQNIGFTVEAKKDAIFARAIEFASQKIDKRTTFGRWFSSLGETFRNDEQAALKKIEASNSAKKKFSSTMALAANVARYGRTVLDLTGYAVASPVRYVMMGSMMFARGSEAAKEARFKNEELIEQTRIAQEKSNEGEAYDQAWAIYRKAEQETKSRSDRSAPTAEDLKKSYREQLPQDIKNRLECIVSEQGASAVAEGLIKRHLSWGVERVQKKLDAVESNQKLSEDAKKEQKGAVYAEYERVLNDYDRMLTQTGVVDTLAYAARSSEKVGKTAVKAITVETAYQALDKLYEIIAKSDFDFSSVSKLLSGLRGAKGDEALEAPPAESVSDEVANVLPSFFGAEGTAPRPAEFMDTRLEPEPPAPPLTSEAPEASTEAPATPEVAEGVEMTDQDRIAATAKHFKFEETKDGGLRLNMAEAAKENANLGKLEQVLDRLVAAQYVDEFGEKLDPDEAAKILNMAANLRVALEQQDASFMDKWTPQGKENLSALFRDALAYDMDKQTLTISNQVKFEQLVDGLKEHADALGAAGNLEGAIGEIPNIKQDTWKEIVNAAQNKEIEVENYNENESVRKAYDANRAREAASVVVEPADTEAGSAALLVEEVTPTEQAAPQERELPRLLDEIKRINQRTTDPHEKSLVNLWEDVRKYSATTNSVEAHKLAAARLYDLEHFADQYQDVRHMYTAGLEQMLDDEVRKGEGVFHLGSANPEKLADFSGKLGRMRGLEEQSSKIFVSWLAGEDNVLDRNDFKRLGLWASENGAVKKNHFDATAFGEKVKEFLGVANSSELPKSGEWQPRTIHYTDTSGANHTEVVNIRAVAVDGGRMYELDGTGDKQADAIEPSSNEPLQYPEDQLNKSDNGGLEILAPDEEETVGDRESTETAPEQQEESVKKEQTQTHAVEEALVASEAEPVAEAVAGAPEPTHEPEKEPTAKVEPEVVVEHAAPAPEVRKVLFTTSDGRNISIEFKQDGESAVMRSSGIVNPDIRNRALPDDLFKRSIEHIQNTNPEHKNSGRVAQILKQKVEMSVNGLALDKEAIEHVSREGQDVSGLVRIYNASLAEAQRVFPGLANYDVLKLNLRGEMEDLPTSAPESSVHLQEGSSKPAPEAKAESAPAVEAPVEAHKPVPEETPKSAPAPESQQEPTAPAAKNVPQQGVEEATEREQTPVQTEESPAVKAEVAAQAEKSSAVEAVAEVAPDAGVDLAQSLRGDLLNMGINPKGGLDASETDKLRGFYLQMKASFEKEDIENNVFDVLKNIMKDDYGINDPDAFGKGMPEQDAGVEAEVPEPAVPDKTETNAEPVAPEDEAEQAEHEDQTVGIERELQEFGSLRGREALNASETERIQSELASLLGGNKLTVPDNNYIVYVNKSPDAQYAALVRYDPDNKAFNIVGADSVSTADPNQYKGAITPEGVHTVVRVGEAKEWSEDYARSHPGSREAFGTSGREVYDLSEGKGIALHSTSEGGKERLGTPASHGCIRISDKFNDLLDKHKILSKGSPVVVGEFSVSESEQPQVASSVDSAEEPVQSDGDSEKSFKDIEHDFLRGNTQGKSLMEKSGNLYRALQDGYIHSEEDLQAWVKAGMPENAQLTDEQNKNIKEFYAGLGKNKHGEYVNINLSVNKNFLSQFFNREGAPRTG